MWKDWSHSISCKPQIPPLNLQYDFVCEKKMKAYSEVFHLVISIHLRTRKIILVFVLMVMIQIKCSEIIITHAYLINMYHTSYFLFKCVQFSKWQCVIFFFNFHEFCFYYLSFLFCFLLMNRYDFIHIIHWCNFVFWLIIWVGTK